MSRSSLAAALIALAAACQGGSEPSPAAGPAAGSVAGSGAPAAAPVDDNARIARLVELARRGPGLDRFPQADAVISEDRDDITLARDGTLTEHHHSVVRVLDAQRGKAKYADVHIRYDGRRQTLAIRTARTITGDGKVHVASADEITDIVPPELTGATIYSSVRERVVSFPAVDTGAVLELDYVRTTRPGPDAPGGGEQLLGRWNPVLARTVTITVPADVTPRLEVIGIPLAPARSVAGDTATYTFSLADLPDRHPEDGMPPDAAVLPRLVYGFQPDWASVVAPLAERYLTPHRLASLVDPTGGVAPRPTGKAGGVPTPHRLASLVEPAVAAEAARLTAGAATAADKARALFAFVAHDIRSIRLPLGAAGYQSHAAEVVLANRYGDDRDKVALLLALCAAVGLDARPVLVRSGHVPVLAAVPTLAQFDRMLARLTVDGAEVWLDPSDEHGQYGLAFAGQDNLVLPITRGGGELGRRPAFEPSTSVAHTTARFALAPSGDLTARYRFELTGRYANRASAELRPLRGERLTRRFQRAATTLSVAAVDRGHTVGDTLSVTGPLVVTHDLAVPRYSEAQGPFRVFELPPTTLGIVTEDSPLVGTSERTYPLMLGTPRVLTEDLSLELPAGWKVAHLPLPLRGGAEGLRYASECTAAARTVTCRTEVTLSRVELPPVSYPTFRAALTQLRGYERRIVLLTRI